MDNSLAPIRPIHAGQPVEWQRSTFSDLSPVTFSLETEQLRDLEDAYRRCFSAGLTVDSLTRDDFPLPSMVNQFEDFTREIETGRGLVVIEGLPVWDWPIEKTELIYLGLASHLGEPVIQSVLGDRVGHVANIGGDDRRERGYRNTVGLKLHTDLAPGIVGMLSIRVAASGGESLYASAVTVHNIICAERPDVLPVLYRGFRLHRNDAAAPGEPLVTPEYIPVFSVCRGQLACRYTPALIAAALDELGQTITPEEREALEVMDEVISRSEIGLETIISPGQMLFASDFVTLHSRSAFVDSPGEGKGRLLFRTWLRSGRPRVPALEKVPTFQRRSDGSTLRRKPRREMSEFLVS